jgi:glutamate synthase (ferredoxin)
MMMRVCNKDTCPFGIATQNEKLRKNFKGKPEYVMNFMNFIAQELREIMAELGFRTVDEMVGRSDCLKMKDHQITERAETVDLKMVIDSSYAKVPERHFNPSKAYDFHLEKTVDEAILLSKFKEALRTGEPTSVDIKVSSTNRTVGTIFGSEVTQKFGDTLLDDTFTVNCEGGGGQSFGAFLPKGVTLRLSGDANDGFGKGLSGGKLVVVPPKGSVFDTSKNIIIGNVALYGATKGKAYIAGVAGERFCVRNSGAVAVAEGCGDHGLEYMTGGLAVILGTTGKNFAAGMSGGIAYVLDEQHDLYKRMNKSMASLNEVTEKYDIEELRNVLIDYVKETGSEHGRKILDNFEAYLPHFKKIVPNDYQRVLAAISKYEEQGLKRSNAVLEAFNEITHKGA